MSASVSSESWRLLGFNWINMWIKHLLLYTFQWWFLDFRVKNQTLHTWPTNTCKIWYLSTPLAPFSSSPTMFQVYWSFRSSYLQGNLSSNMLYTCCSLCVECSSSTSAWLTPTYPSSVSLQHTRYFYQKILPCNPRKRLGPPVTSSYVEYTEHLLFWTHQVAI